MHDKPDLLLHICCAPDATVAFERLSVNFRVSGFFYNPNIYPYEEYVLRLQAAIRLSSLWDFELNRGSFDQPQWFQRMQGLEQQAENGKRCEACFSFNLHATALKAKALGISWFSTSLFTSRRKDLSTVEKAGYHVQKQTGVFFYYEPFRKNQGFDRSVTYSEELKLYRQNYCGCMFSRINEGKEVG